MKNLSKFYLTGNGWNISIYSIVSAVCGYILSTRLAVSLDVNIEMIAILYLILVLGGSELFLGVYYQNKEKDNNV